MEGAGSLREARRRKHRNEGVSEANDRVRSATSRVIPRSDRRERLGARETSGASLSLPERAGGFQAVFPGSPAKSDPRIAAGAESPAKSDRKQPT